MVAAANSVITGTDKRSGVGRGEAVDEAVRTHGILAGVMEGADSDTESRASLSGSSRARLLNPEAMIEIQRGLDQRPFEAPRWLRGPHLQTFWSPVFRRRPRLDWSLERLKTEDGDHLRLHHLFGRSDHPTVLILHGLEGSVRSNYVAGLARRFQQRGWSVCVMEFRGCGGEFNTARRLYHSGETTDLATVAKELTHRMDAVTPHKQGTPLYLVGFSLGGNVVAKWLGESAESLPELVSGAAAVSMPFDLEISGPTLDRTLAGFYRWRFLRTLRPKALAKERQFPGSMNARDIRRARTFEEFDTLATARLHGFEDAWDYWRKSGCGQFLDRVDRPLLLVSSRDDPFNPVEAIPEQRLRELPWLVTQFPRRGGHVGFVMGKPWRTRHWAEEQVESFLVKLWTRSESRRG